MDTKDKEGVVLINASKKELCTIHSGFKSLQRKLKGDLKVASNKDPINNATLSHAKVFVLGGSREMFTASELESLKNYIDNGGSMLIMMGEGGEPRFETNINYLLEQYKIMVNSDAVVRNVYYKYFHPKEALVSNGVLNRAISLAAGKVVVTGEDDSLNSQALTFVYPFGATLNVQRPAVAVLSTGSVCFPVNRPVCALYTNKHQSGKIAVVGSTYMFSDSYIDKEDNNKILDVIFQFLTTDEVQLDEIDAADPEIADYNFMPHTGELAEELKACLHESEDVPRDFTQLFDSALFQLDTSLVPKIIRAYEELHVKHEPLTLITPQFETPLPPLDPAVFPPQFRELLPPPLELFDLDESFSSEKVRLAQLTNKCSDDDIDYFVRECGDIMDITNSLPQGKRTSKHVLEFVLNQLVEYKKINQGYPSHTEMDYASHIGSPQQPVTPPSRPVSHTRSPQYDTLGSVPQAYSPLT
ncbi:PREDICTED: intraflagellar transport protein 52 homolog isoform X3 [Priapulus caudatus]|nr:PREDICTED: intraflagellar transport protein 52 homolog isoform X3 [Priapulus caudatus]XP_014663858.1 PREDICTED: intraflagellar transport protein 52 homolog isoform X3 [Priapulus caudatus]XP_014663859.1 PREDICTED: intraflagellar transport protein 52 homolog isoform X3 [Priapulus caudatus]XP_014663860.1 PREDICTED: intraflagellar transport protein 52 homolog isoform X3 [Priapulus caudatus]